MVYRQSDQLVLFLYVLSRASSPSLGLCQLDHSSGISHSCFRLTAAEGLAVSTCSGLPPPAIFFYDMLLSSSMWYTTQSSLLYHGLGSLTQVRLMDEAGYELGNLDATLILQKPKISPHKEAIKANMSALLGADPSVVNLKAKTHEKVDSLGENRSIAAHTVVLLMKK
ncbi:hypothetical protein Cgig2_001695 [Carnegiea gigantea]|uniref:2-C-methyl-D-erythritol 2,4-cyclodiphosphate synthase domain-containing protein n=1 Tax=Carnegiea gigantea TaxID=171969 RepID=A0A9Q1GW17_9CARY|nr:hypothetical protein Cgig2_001695 [Carnegiea gigantea]